MKSQLLRNDHSASVAGRAAGLTLVELLVAMTIGLVLIVGATQVYLDSSKSYAVNETTARLQENARYALSVLEPDIRMSGYWGLTNVSDRITGEAQPTDAQSALGGPAASTCGVNFPLLLGFPVQGTNDSYTATCAAGDIAVPGNSAAMPNADTITVRRASAVTVLATSANGPLRICSTRTSGLLVTDISGSFCQDPNAQINNLIVNLYYTDQSSSQAGVPSLRRKALNAGPAFQDDEIVPGVEDLQVQYGVDLSGGFGAASEYLNAGAALTNLLNPPPPAIPAQIVAVRIWLLVRSDSPESGFTDDRTYEYGDRLLPGTTGDLTSVADNTKAYQPSLSADNSFTSVKHYRRLLVSKTIRIRNALQL